MILYVQKPKVKGCALKMTGRIVSIDAGNAFCKGVRAGRRNIPTSVAFPNAWARPQQDALSRWQGFNTKEQLLISLNVGETLALGESAFELGRSQHQRVGYVRYDNPEFPWLVAGLLAKLYPTAGGEILLTFSLPIDGFSRAQEQIERLQGRWQVEYNDGRSVTNLNFTVLPDNVVPEAFGSLCYFILAVDGSRFVDLEMAEGRVAVIDIGGYTTDVLTFNALEIGTVHGSVERGIITVREKVNAAIKRQFQRSDLQTPALDKIIETGEYKHAGEVHDVDGIVEEALWDLTDGVLDIWQNQLEGGVDYDAIILTGGGAPLISPSLLGNLRHSNIKCIPRDEAHLANAIGAYRYALHLKA
jgi:hypothetical protein